MVIFRNLYRKKQNPLIISFFLIILIISIAILYFESLPSYTPTKIILVSGSLCHKAVGTFRSAFIFDINEDVYFCGDFDITNEIGLKPSVDIWVYVGDTALYDFHRIYFNADLTNGYQVISIARDLDPGNYLFVIRRGKNAIFQEEFRVKE